MPSPNIVVNVLGDITDFQKKLGQAGNDAATFGSKLGTVGDSLKTVGSKMSTHLTLPIVGGLGLAAKSFGDFEKSLNTFQAVAAATGTEMAVVSQRAKDLGNDAK